MKREWAEQVHTPEAKSTRSSTPRCVVPTGLAFGVWSWGLWPARIDQTNWQPRTAASKIFHGCQTCLLACFSKRPSSGLLTICRIFSGLPFPCFQGMGGHGINKIQKDGSDHDSLAGRMSGAGRRLGCQKKVRSNCEAICSRNASNRPRKGLLETWTASEDVPRIPGLQAWQQIPLLRC